MSLSPVPGSYVRVYQGSGSDETYSNEAMEEVDLSDPEMGGYARYTVYRIEAAAKRIMNDTAVPVFQKQTGGEGEWSTLAASDVWYGAGYIVVSALNSADKVRCASGKYLTPSAIFGCTTRKFTTKTEMIDATVYGDAAVIRHPGVDDWDATLEVLFSKVRAVVLTTGGADNSHIQGTHIPGGVAGNGGTLTFADTDQGTLTVAVAADDITVDLETALGSPISTADEVIAALNADLDVRALGHYYKRAESETGEGVVAASGPFTFAGGLDEIDFAAMKGTRRAFRLYNGYADGDMWVGFGFVSDVDWIGGPKDLTKAGLTIQGSGYKLYHVVE